MATKTFTVQEANALIPRLEELLAEMDELREKIQSQSGALETASAQAKNNGGGKQASEYLEMVERFNADYKLIADLGCEVKDPQMGLIDFPSYRDGELVYLCWKRGEPRIAFWHTLESGFPGRQPL